MRLAFNFVAVAAALAAVLMTASVGNAKELSSLLTLTTTVENEQPSRTEAEPEATEPAVLVKEINGSSVIDSADTSTLRLVPNGTEPLQQPDPHENFRQPPQPADGELTDAQSGASGSEQKSLEPIPDQQPAGPPKVEAASFKGVTPGETTGEQLQEAWGMPQEVRTAGRQKLYLFSVGPFQRVEVAVGDGTVLSIVIQLDKPFPSGAVTKQLQLGNIRPVFISNELGDVLGQAFPERGVMFAFVQNHEPGRPSMKVDKIVLEPIDAEAFVLRAETNIDGHCKNTLNDLDIAVKLSPDNAKAHWLRSRVLAATGATKEAVSAGQKAVRLDSGNPQYRMAFARVLAQAGKQKEAIEHIKTAIAGSGHRPHIKAAAQCLLGDMYGSGDRPDFKAAIEQHIAAIKTADPLSVDRHPAIRLAAKEVLIDAHLGAANDIAWGGWSKKEKAVKRWCQRASAFAEELIANDGGSEEHYFRVATRSLAAYVGVKDKLDPKQYAEEAARVGDVLIGLNEDPVKKRQLQCDLGMALFNAMQIAQARKDNKAALKYGEQTVGYLEAAIEQGLDNPTANYLLGRLYFRIGAIHALAQKDHAAAVVWFEKAVPLLSRQVPADSQSELGRHGETFVSMGVSYWTTGEKKKAIELTKVGLALMKKAVTAGVMKKPALSVPYQNLAAMQRHLGNGKSAEQFEQMAKSVMVPKDSKKMIKR
jgi:tetratricopeptide (TPR) repeat protein/HAMP domain-containing protein